MKGVLVSLAFVLPLASAAGLEQIEHVILYMQENRALYVCLYLLCKLS